MGVRKQPALYILANTHNTTLYVGVTHDLARRIAQHKNKLIPGFTKRYNVDELVYYEFHSEMRDAIAREKQLKAGSREKKEALIVSMNPEWRDLFIDFAT